MRQLYAYFANESTVRSHSGEWNFTKYIKKRHRRLNAVKFGTVIDSCAFPVPRTYTRGTCETVPVQNVTNHKQMSFSLYKLALFD